jgi:subtilisin family serine protease
MNPLNTVQLTPLMQLSSGTADIVVALIDGPVTTSHPDLSTSNIREVDGQTHSACASASSLACAHGTFVAGILVARRESVAPAICPGCTLLVRPIFTEAVNGDHTMPSASPEELATAILECLEAGAHVLNLSVGLAQPSTRGERKLEEALFLAAKQGVIVVAAAGNQAAVGSSAITRHAWVIPVVACDERGRPTDQSNLGSSIGRRGLTAPGDAVLSLGTGSKPITAGGTSIATPFVTGAVALLRSLFPKAPGAQVKLAVSQAGTRRRGGIAPPLLNAWAAYQALAAAQA